MIVRKTGGSLRDRRFDNDPERLYLFRNLTGEAADSFDDLWNAISREHVRHCRNYVTFRNPQPIKSDDSQIWGAVDEHKIVIV